MNVLVMGVSGAGKSYVGVRAAERLGLPFVEGDDHHPPANTAKMAAGTPLDDDDRRPWLRTLAALLAEHEVRGGCVLASSALKASYRDLLRSRLVAPLFVVYLDASRALLEERLAARTGHFFPPHLLDSQLATLEKPVGAYYLDLSHAIDRQLDGIAAHLAERVATYETALVRLASDPLGWTARLPVPPEAHARIPPRDDGSRRVVCSVRGIRPWHAALTSDGRGGHYVIFSKDRVRALEAAGVAPERLAVELVPDESRYGARVPVEFAEVLALDPAGEAHFHALTPGTQRGLLHLVGAPKREATRMRKALAVTQYLEHTRGAFDWPGFRDYLKASRP